MPEPIIIIPARLGSTRFPAKVLAADTGKPLILHVCDTAAASGLPRVVVATDTEQIAAPVRAAGYEAVLTAESHPNGTSRIAEVATKLDLSADTLIINLQGDEPDLPPDVIRDIAAASDAAGLPATEAEPAHITTVCSPFAGDEDPASPNIVKAVLAAGDEPRRALYFSRSLIPHPAHGGQPAQPLKHVGIYAYKAGFVTRYADMAPTPLERAEKLEQLRALEHGCTIAAIVRQVHSRGIDTPADYADFVARWKRSRGGA